MWRMPSWVARILDVPGAHARPMESARPLRPDNERILKIEQAAKSYALHIVGIPAWDTVPPVDENTAEAAHDFPEVEEQLERERQAHIANPANWTPGFFPREHPAYHDCYLLFKNLQMHLHSMIKFFVLDVLPS